MPRLSRLLLPATLAVLLALGTTGPASAVTPRVPQGFAGVMLDGPVFNSRVNLDRQLDTMVSSGVESVRVVFDWSSAQPYRNWSQVPPARADRFANGPRDVPTDFNATDRVVAATARRGLPVLPVVVYAPKWDTLPDAQAQPRRPGPYADYVSALDQRYGPGGIFWSENPELPYVPIQRWQIWNEPNLNYFWATAPFAPSYVALLRAAHDVLKRENPAAQIVLAGLTNHSWGALGTIYRVKGARSLFDLVAVHPYTAEPKGVLTILGYVRKVMNHYGDRRKAMLVTEFGWPSSLGHTRQTFGIATSERDQAFKLGQVIPMLAGARRRLGLAGFDLYAWMGTDSVRDGTFSYSGLLRFDAAAGRVVAKPGLSVFSHTVLALERCRVKGRTARSCRHPG